jgi:hypothetical protein
MSKQKYPTLKNECWEKHFGVIRIGRLEYEKNREKNTQKIIES